MSEMAAGPSVSNLIPLQTAAETNNEPSEEMLFNVVQAVQLAALEKPATWHMQSAGTEVTAKQARAWTYPPPEMVPELAKFAHQTLAERYTPLAAEVARVSLGQCPVENLQEAVYPGDQHLLASLSKMQSPRAVLADRVQAASVALLESIWAYSVTSRQYKREPFLFSWYAVRRMHTALREHAATEELFAFTPDVVEDYHAMHKGETNAAFVGTARQTVLRRLRGLTDITSLDELTDEGLAEVCEDAPFDEVHFREFLGRLKKWFGEPHMSYFLQAYGLEGGSPIRPGEIAKELGFSKSYVDELHRRCLLLLDIFRPVAQRAWHEGTSLPPEKAVYLRDQPE